MARTIRDSKGREWRLEMTFRAFFEYEKITGHNLFEIVDAETGESGPAKPSLPDAPAPVRMWRPLRRLATGDCSSFLVLATLIYARQCKRRHLSDGAFLAAVVNEETLPVLIWETRLAIAEWMKDEFVPLLSKETRDALIGRVE